MKKSIIKFVSGALLLGGLVFNLTFTNSQIDQDWIGLSLTSSTAVAQSEVNPNCPNGCLTYLGTCYCYGTHAYKEAKWN